MCVESFLSWRAGATQDAGDALFEAILAVVPVSLGATQFIPQQLCSLNYRKLPALSYL